MSARLLERPHQFPDCEIAFGEFRLYPARQQLLHADSPVPLGGRAFLILLALVEKAGELVEKETLVSRVWPGVFVENSNLRVHVAALRKALGRGGGERYIASVAGRGYRFVAPVTVTWAGADSPRPPVHNLVDRITSVVGREALIGELDAKLADRRLITLTGPGGIGKTTVAVATARRQLGAHPDGVWIVDLAPTSDPALLPAAVASMLGLAVLSGDATQILTAFLQDKRMLLVLDSCEQTLNAAARLAETVLRRAPGVRMIATSREPLGAEGEWVKRLGPLDAPPASADLTAAEALAWPAVQLFVERAAGGLGEFTLSDEDAPLVAEICRRLDGVALAIELGAGQVEALGVRGLVSVLDEHFLLLMRGRRTALARHQTLGATLEWSYGRLPEAEQRLLRRLGVMTGDFTLKAAAGVAADSSLPADEIADRLVSLVVKSLVSAKVAGPAPRYRLLDATRAYALRQLRAAGEFDETAARHARFILERLGETAQSACDMPPFGPEEVHAALDWAHANAPETALALTLGALPFWLSTGRIDDCRRRVEQAIPLAEAPGADDTALMRLQGALVGVLLNTHGAGPELERVSLRVLALAEAADDAEHQLRGLWGLWIHRCHAGRHREALEIARRFAAVAAGQPVFTPADAVAADRMLGISLHHLGDDAAALRHLDQVLIACPWPERSSFNLPYHFDQRISALCHRARIQLIQGRSESAMRTVAAVVAEAWAIRHLPSLAYALSEVACPFAIVTGDLQLAQTYVDLLVESSHDQGMEAWRSNGRFYSGWLLLRQGDPAAALPILREALGRLRDTRFFPIVTPVFAEAAGQVGDTDAMREALMALDAAILRGRQGEEHWFHAELLRAKAELLLAQDGPAGEAPARELLRAAAELARSKGALRFELRVASSLARLERRSPSGGVAREVLAETLGRFREGSDNTDLVRARRLLATGDDLAFPH